ncbi:MAG: Ig-like domain-containing protein [Thermotoga caldifontis]|uniref:Ig-like domain-containing protein n=1 Tax=Thermotoga caldifontis TaxID=1508419 RepID=UPI003C7A098A
MKIVRLLLVLILLALVSCAMLDKNPPRLDVSVQKLASVANESFVLNVSASDESGIDRVEIYANDRLIYRTSQLGQISFPAPYGSFTLRVVVFDRVGNVSSRVIGQFRTIDLTAPSVTIVTSPTSPLPGETVTVFVNAEDKESGIRVSGLRVNNKEVQLVNNRHTFQVQAGTYTLEAYAVDNEGNTNTAKLTLSVSIAGDTTGPEISFPDLPKKVRPGSAVSITIVASDPSGVARIVFNDGRELQFVPSEPSTSVTWNLVRNTGTTNPYIFTVTAYDSRNNHTSKTGTVEIGLNLPPSVSIQVDKPAPVENEKVKITVQASDDSTVKQVVLYIDNVPVRTFNQPPYEHEWTAVKGIHRIKTVAIDDANESSEAYYTINVGVEDREPPTIYFTPPYGVPVNQAYTFYVFVTDNVQVDRVEMTFSGPESKGPLKTSPIGGGVFTLTETFTVKGTYEVFVTAYDTKGNNSTQKGQFLVDEAYIVKAPRIKEFSYAPSTLAQGERVHFKVVAEDDLGLSRCDFFVDGVKRDSISPTVNVFEWDWLATVLGEHEIRVVVVDVEGFTAEATGSLVVTTERPIVQILQPEDGLRTPFAPNMSLSLNAQVIDTNEPAQAYFDVKGPVDETITVTPSGSGPVYSFSTNWRVKQHGEYRIDFYYKNNVNLSGSASITVNILDLGVVFEQPLPGQLHQCGYELLVRARTSVYLTKDAAFVVSHANRRVEYRVPTPSATTSTYNIYEMNVPRDIFSEPGNYTIDFVAKTDKGEEGRGTSFVVVIDSEPPRITTAKLDGKDIIDGGIYNHVMSSTPSVTVSAQDNRQVASMRLQKRVSGVYTDIATSSSSTLNVIITDLNPFENQFRIVVRDLDNNETTLNFMIYAYETEKPNSEGLRSFQIYPSSEVYDMNVPVLVQIRGSLNNNTQFKVSDDTGLKEVSVIVVDRETNGANYSEIIKKLFEYTSGNLVREIFISNQDVPMFTPARVGEYYVMLKVFDVFNNSTVIAQQNIRVEDLTPPIVSIDIPEGKYYGTGPEGKKILRSVTDVKVSFLDNTEPIHRVELWLIDASGNSVKVGEKSDLATNSWTFENVPLTTYVDGVAKFVAKATTTSGAIGTGELSVVIDNKTQPAVSIRLPDAPTFDGKRIYRSILPVEAIVENTDVPHDVQKIELYIDDVRRLTLTSPVQDGGAKYIFALNTANHIDGVHRIALKVYDWANNQSQLTDVRSFADVIFDNSAPILLSDNGKVYTNQPTVELAISEEFGVVEAILKVDDRLIQPWPGTFMFDHGLPPDSSASFSLYVRDTAGNSANYSGTLYHDATAPVISMIRVEPTEIASETGVRFDLNVSDNLTNVATLSIYVNDVSQTKFSINQAATNVSWSYRPPADVEEAYTFKFEAYDKAGNRGELTRRIDVDTRAPRIGKFECIDAQRVGDTYHTKETSATVTWNVVDANFAGVAVYVNGVPRITDGSDSGTISVGLNDGSNVIKLTANDRVGHSSEETIQIVLDRIQPQISNVEIDNVSVTEDGTSVTLQSAGNKTLKFTVLEENIDWDKSAVYVDGNNVSPGKSWNRSQNGASYSVSTTINVLDNSQVQILLKDYAGNEKSFSFRVLISGE